MKRIVYIHFDNGKFYESTSSLYNGYVLYDVDDASINYRWNNAIILQQLNFSLFDWKFNNEIKITESCNYNDKFQLKFYICSVSPSGKCEETEFSGLYLYDPMSQTKSAAVAVITAIYLIASTGNPKWAKEIYERVLVYPLLSAYPKAYTYIYNKALTKLLDTHYMINAINTKTTLSKQFYNYVVNKYNDMLLDFTDNIMKYRSENRMDLAD